MNMQLNAGTIGSYRTFNGAIRKASYWKLVDAFLAVWALMLLFGATFAFGYFKGAVDADAVNTWASQIRAQ